ncbi:MAG: hypothetical protein ACOX8M_05845 [Marvinbryantia sp.]
MYLRKQHRSCPMPGITEKSQMLRGMCRGMWKMALERCTEQDMSSGN